MLSYQHIFHAGNHADILKHTVLISVLESLNKKEKPYTFYDTHSGSGLYDLLDNRSLKTGEAQNGIIKITKELSEVISETEIPELLQKYYSFLQPYLGKNLYPGSPEIESKFMRKGDCLILSELHPQEIKNLNENIKKTDKQTDVQIHNRNGWEMLKALTPPKTKRGAVLIDPSYEETADYTDASKTINEVHKKWSNGIIMLWYPLLAHREGEINLMLESIEESAKMINENIEISNLQLIVADKNSHVEVSLEENASVNKKPRLYGSGMLVLNSPWKLEEQVFGVIEYLKNKI